VIFAKLYKLVAKYLACYLHAEPEE